MKVRTDGGAMVTAAILGAVLSIVAVGDGRPAGSAPGTFDSYALQALQGGLTYLAVFVAGHWLARRLNFADRWLYAMLGSVAALIAIAIQTPPSLWRLQVEQGTISQPLIIIGVFGAVMGFVYRWRADLEAEGDDPQALAEALASHGDAAAPALANTGSAEYFSGPVQVRSSLPLMFVAALLSAGLYGIALVLFGAAQDMAPRLAAGAPLAQSAAMSFKSQLLTIGMMGLVAPLPFTLVVLFAHMVVKGMNKTSYRAYATAGAVAALPVALIMGPAGFFLALWSAIPLALAMSVYRNMAGLEPRPVREDIRVKDRRHLVGADHPRRQFGRVLSE